MEFQETGRQAYARLEPDREGYLCRARDASKLTLTYLIPPEGYDGTGLEEPFQSIGAEGVTTLAGKLLLAHFPPGNSFVRMVVDDYSMEQLKKDYGEQKAEQIRTEAAQSLLDMENAGVQEIETSGIRPKLDEMIKHHLVAGNVLVKVPETSDQNLQLWGLDQYVVERDDEDNLLLCVLKRSIAVQALQEDLRALVLAEDKTKKDSKASAIDVYTVIARREDASWEVWSELSVGPKGYRMGEIKKYKDADDLPWRPLRMFPVDGEAYGHGFIPLHFGSLNYAEQVREALMSAGAAMSKLLIGIRNGSPTRAKDIQDAKNLDVIRMNEEDVWILSFADKIPDLRYMSEEYNSVKQALERAFLMTTSIQRNAERVTAREWEILAQELESGLAGAYSQFASDFSQWFVSHTIARMQREGRAPKFPPEIKVKPLIVTGIDALGRGKDVQALQSWFRFLAETMGPDAAAQIIHKDELAKRAGALFGVKTASLLKTEEELAQEAQDAQLQSIAQTLGPEVAKLATQPQGGPTRRV